MNHEDDIALAIMTEAACALLATLAAEGIDIPETRALEAAVLTQYARPVPEIIPFDDPRHVPKVIGDRVYSPNGIFSWPRAGSEYERASSQTRPLRHSNTTEE